MIKKIVDWQKKYGIQLALLAAVILLGTSFILQIGSFIADMAFHQKLAQIALSAGSVYFLSMTICVLYATSLTALVMGVRLGKVKVKYYMTYFAMPFMIAMFATSFNGILAWELVGIIDEALKALFLK